MGSQSPLEGIVQRMKKWDSSPLGRLQILSHRWLTRLEGYPLVRSYGTIFRKSRLPIGVRSEPTINVDSIFLISLVFHILILILLSWTTLASSTGSQPGPIRVQFIEVAKRVQRQPAKRVKTARQRPKRARSNPKPKAVAKVAPSLPAPKVLAKPPMQSLPTFNPRAVEAMVSLPTRQSSAVQSPQPDEEPAEAASVAVVSKEEMELTKGLLHGQESPAVEGRTSAMQSPDFAPYLEKIKRRVESVWNYPPGIGGVQKVNLVFVLDPGGKLVRADVLNSTDPALDQSVLQAVRRASPFPPIPDSLKDLAGWPLRIRFNIDFGLKAAR